MSKGRRKWMYYHKKRERILPFFTFYFLFGLPTDCMILPTLAKWMSLLSQLNQMLISCRNTRTDTPRSKLPAIWASVKLTHKINLHTKVLNIHFQNIASKLPGSTLPIQCIHFLFTSLLLELPNVLPLHYTEHFSQLHLTISLPACQFPKSLPLILVFNFYRTML